MTACRMPFLELTLDCRLDDEPRCESALEAAGALAVSLQDAHLDQPDEQAIFEPGVGETPLWQHITMTALFEADADRQALLDALMTAEPALDWQQASWRTIADQDWERAWMDQYQPLQFGRRTWIVPWNRDLPEAATHADAAVVRLDPGLAFGSGTHPTTALCLQWLDVLADTGELQDRTVLDFGCGSGILALAALQLGAARAVATDSDPQAVQATTDNADRNGLAARLQVCAPHALPPGPYPVVVANILAVALATLAPQLTSMTAPGGRIALSGILPGQDADLLSLYAAGFDDLRVIEHDGWVRIEGVRKI